MVLRTASTVPSPLKGKLKVKIHKSSALTGTYGIIKPG